MPEYKSDYYREKDMAQLEEIRRLQTDMPSYTSEYVSHLRRSRQHSTVISYLREVLDFLRYLVDQNPMLSGKQTKEIPLEILASLTYSDIDEYEDYLQLPRPDKNGHLHQKGTAALKRSVSALSSFFKYMVVHEYIPKDPTLGATRNWKEKKKPIEYLDKREVKALTNGVEASESGSEKSRSYTVHTQLRDTAIIKLLLGTGIRVSECVGLDVKDINMDKQSIRVVRKGGDIEEVYFNDDVKTALNDYITLERPLYVQDKDEAALFLSLQKKRIGVRGIQLLVNKYGEANLPNREALHPHTLRKTFGTNMYNQTSDIYLVADALGHKNVAVTQKHYTAMTDQHRAMNKELNLYDDDEEN